MINVYLYGTFGSQGTKAKSSRRGTDIGKYTGIHASGSSNKKPTRNHHTFGSLVCDQQTRKWKSKPQVDFRLQAYKPAFQGKTIQVGPLKKHFSLLEKRLWAAKVVLKNAYFHLESRKSL